MQRAGCGRACDGCGSSSVVSEVIVFEQRSRGLLLVGLWPDACLEEKGKNKFLRPAFLPILCLHSP